MNKTTLILGFVVVGLFLALSATLRSLNSANDDIKRLESNQEAYFDSITIYKAKNELNVYQIKRLNMTKDEFKKTNSTLLQQVENMKVKIKRLNSVDRVVNRTEYVFVPDTIYYPAEQKGYRWKDAWLSFEMDSCGVNIEAKDTIHVVRHQRIKRFLWWVRKRDMYISVQNSNPHTSTTTIESITID